MLNDNELLFGFHQIQLHQTAIYSIPFSFRHATLEFNIVNNILDINAKLQSHPGKSSVFCPDTIGAKKYFVQI